jgi:putative chitinase
MLTADLLTRLMPRCPAAELYAPLLEAAMVEASITTVTRAAAFLAQLAWESGDLRYMEELADGSAYEGRADLGNSKPGDGRRYKGRGPIQLTGRANYRAAGAALGLDLEADPALAARPEVGFRVAAWYWTSRDLNAVADRPDFRAVTRKINGAATDHAPSHHLRRVEVYYRALELLGVAAALS